MNLMRKHSVRRILMIEPLRGRTLRVFFASGRVIDAELPARASDVSISAAGLGVDLGGGRDISADALATWPKAKVWAA